MSDNRGYLSESSLHLEDYSTNTSLGHDMFNDTLTVTVPPLSCGPEFCPRFKDITATTNTSRMDKSNGALPDRRPLFLLLGVLGCFNVVGILVSLFGITNYPPEDFKAQETKHHGVCHHLCRYVQAFFDWRFLLLSLSIAYIHLFLAMMGATFTRAYITCSEGIGMIGYISMARGITGLFANTCVGILEPYIHQNILFGFAFILCAIQILMWLLWQQISYPLAAMFAVAALNGITNGTNIIHFTAFLGATFTAKKTEAFSFYHFVSGIVVAIGFLQNNYICVRYQIYTVMTTMCVALVTFTVVNVYLHRHQPPSSVTIETRVLTSDEKVIMLDTTTATSRQYGQRNTEVEAGRTTEINNCGKTLV